MRTERTKWLGWPRLLHLACKTPLSWTQRALGHLDEVLLDHAHCEQRAASMALGLTFRYPEEPRLVARASALAREELGHFERMLGVLAVRGIRFRRQRPSPYASELMSIVRTHEPARLVDTLLACAMIEARSCERMQILADAVDDVALSRLYESLLVSEAGHHAAYVELARGIGAGPEVDLRLSEIARHEARVISQAPPMPRLHSGS